MIIHTLSIVHTEALVQLRRQAVEEFPEYFSPTIEEIDAGLEPIEARLCSPDDAYLGAFLDEQLVGVVRFERDKHIKLRHQAIVGSLYVIPDLRRRGIGRALMVELIAQARQWGVEQLALEVGSSNQDAHRLYGSLGFAVYGTAPRAIKFQDRYYDEDLMVLYLWY